MVSTETEATGGPPLPFFVGGEEEENSRKQLPSIAYGRVLKTMMKNAKEKKEALYARIMMGSCFGLIGEMWKRGKGLFLGMVCNVSLLAYYFLLRHPFSSGGDTGGLRHAFASLSSSAIGVAWLGVMLGCAFCIVGQGAANLITSAKVPPDVIMTAALCGGLLFFVVKEICNELNEASPVTEKVPLVAISEMISPAAKAKWFPPVTLNFTADWQSSYHDAMCNVTD